jgi:hypothetical protein
LFQTVYSNIGIATSTPNARLTINGAVSATGAITSNGNLTINNRNYNKSNIGLVNYLGTQAILATDVNNWNNSLRIADSLDADYPNTVSLYSNNNIRMFVAANGNVKIGSDSNPQAKLDVAGDVKASNTPKAWVSFDATRQANGSPVTGNQYLYIRSSYNVSGVFRIGGGQYQVYFTNPITGDYCVTGTSEHYRGSNAALVYIDRVPSNGSGPIQTTYCTINTLSYNGAAYDSAAYVSVVIYGA